MTERSTGQSAADTDHAGAAAQPSTSTQRTLPAPEQAPAPARQGAGASGATAVGQPASPGLVDRLQSSLGRADDHREGEVKPAPPARPRRTTASRRPARRARLRLTRVDPWSVMKTAFLLAIAFGVVTVVSVLMVWSVLGAAGVWESINATVQNVVGDDTATTFDIENYLGTSRVLGFTLLVAVIDVVLLTAIATLAAFLYNMAAALLGGIEVTLAEDGR